jgi:hypothetical protein
VSLPGVRASCYVSDAPRRHRRSLPGVGRSVPGVVGLLAISPCGLQVQALHLVLGLAGPLAQRSGVVPTGQPALPTTATLSPGIEATCASRPPGPDAGVSAEIGPGRAQQQPVSPPGRRRPRRALEVFARMKRAEWRGAGLMPSLRRGSMRGCPMYCEPPGLATPGGPGRQALETLRPPVFPVLRRVTRPPYNKDVSGTGTLG